MVLFQLIHHPFYDSGHKSGKMTLSSAEEYARRLIKGSAVIFIALVTCGFIGFLVRIFLARTLSVIDYGLFYAVLALVNFLALFRDLGLNSALVKYIPEFLVRRNFEAIKSSIILVASFQAIFASLITTLLFLSSHWLALTFFKNEAAVLPLQILSAWFFTMVFYTVIRSAFQGFQNMTAYASMEFSWIIFIFFLIVLFSDRGIAGVAFAYLIATLMVTILSFMYLVTRYPYLLEKGGSTKELSRDLFGFAFPVFVGGLGGIILAYTDTLMLTFFHNLPEVGYYQVAQPITYILWMFVASLATAFFPMVSELWAKKKRELLNTMLQFLLKFSFLFILPATLIFISFPEIVINLLFGPRYLKATGALRILAVGAIVYTLYTILTTTMSGIGKPIICSKVMGAMAGLNFITNLIFIPLYGIEGAAMTTLLSNTLGLLLMLRYSGKFVKFKVPTISMLKTAVGGVITLFSILILKFYLRLPILIETIIVVTSSLVLYGMWIFATKTITKSDLKLLSKIFK